LGLVRIISRVLQNVTFFLAEKHRFSALLRAVFDNTPTTPPEMANSVSQCAVGPDGTLLDTSDIQWFNDPDDVEPLPSTLLSVTPGDSTVTSSEPEVHPFCRKSVLPATTVAGALQSTHAIHPSARAIDPDNMETSTSTRQKCSCKASLPSQHTSHKVIPSDTEASEHNEYLVSATDKAMEPDSNEDGTTFDEYNWLQVMADADHEVKSLPL